MADIKLEGAGNVIRKFRQAKGLGIRELAEALDWDRGRLSRYETNRLALSMTAIEEIARGLRVRPEVLVLACLEEMHSGMESSRIGRLLRDIVRTMG